MTDYEVLKRYGHSAAKAAEIELDAKRGDKHALTWLELARSTVPQKAKPDFGYIADLHAGA